MKKIYTSLLTAMLVLFSVSFVVGQSEEGPIEITSFADSTNITAGDNFQHVFMQGDEIKIEGAYGNIANAVSAWVTYDVYAPDWSGLVYSSGQQIIANDTIGTLDGVIDFTFTLPEDAAVFGQFHEDDGPVANHIIQVRIAYEPEVNTFWNIFIEVEGEEVVMEAPLAITSIDGVDPAGMIIPATQGESVNIQGTYVTTDVTSVTAAYLVFNPDWSEAYSNVKTIADASTGLDGTINYDYSFPADAPTIGSVDDVSDPNMPLAGFYLLQVRVNTDPVQDIFVNTNVEVSEGDKTTGLWLPVLEGLNVSPNPANTYLKIITPENKEKHVSMFDATGRRVIEQVLGGDILDINNLEKGFYFLRVEQDGKVGSQKIMVENN